MSDEMKLIMEGWRDYFGKFFDKEPPKEKRDQRDPVNIEDPNLPPALLVHVDRGKHELILYKPSVKYDTDPPSYSLYGVIGWIQVMKTSKPCIPPTFQVDYSAVHSDFQGQGYGSLMYGMAFHYTNNVLGAGLTSDHNYSSSKKAIALWDKLADTKGMVKKKTKGPGNMGGHDEFDYTGRETPSDKKDDCDWGSPNATDHSWIMRNNKFKNVFSDAVEQHNFYMSTQKPENRKSFVTDILNYASKLFRDVYGA